MRSTTRSPGSRTDKMCRDELSEHMNGCQGIQIAVHPNRRVSDNHVQGVFRHNRAKTNRDDMTAKARKETASSTLSVLVDHKRDSDDESQPKPIVGGDRAKACVELCRLTANLNVLDNAPLPVLRRNPRRAAAAAVLYADSTAKAREATKPKPIGGSSSGVTASSTLSVLVDHKTSRDIDDESQTKPIVGGDRAKAGVPDASRVRNIRSKQANHTANLNVVDDAPLPVLRRNPRRAAAAAVHYADGIRRYPRRAATSDTHVSNAPASSVRCTHSSALHRSEPSADRPANKEKTDQPEEIKEKRYPSRRR